MTERRARYTTGHKRQRSKKVTYFGIAFDSQLEANRYLELRSMQERDEISELTVHPKYTLQPSFKMYNGERVRAITYTADFEYVYEILDVSGLVPVTVVEDVKAWMTDKRTGRRRPLVQEDCELKIKMLKHLRPDIEFRITGGE